MRRQDGISTEAVGRAAHAGASVVRSQLAAGRFGCIRFLSRVRLSESTGRRRAQRLRRKTRHSGRSGQGDACEEQAQGNGETPVRVMLHQARTRRGGGIPPTKHRDANGGCSAREESSFSPKGATSMRRLCPAPEGAKRGHGRGRSRYPPERSGVAEGDALAGVRNPFRRGGLHRTRPRSRICIRRAGRRTGKAPASKGEHGCPDRDRTLESKPAQHRQS